MMNEEGKSGFVEEVKSELASIDALDLSARSVAFEKVHAQLEETLSTIDGL